MEGKIEKINMYKPIGISAGCDLVPQNCRHLGTDWCETCRRNYVIAGVKA